MSFIAFDEFIKKMHENFPYTSSEIKGILNTSLARLDLEKDSKNHAFLKILSTEANRMQFYDIPLENESKNSRKSEKKLGFRSIHRNTGTKTLSKLQKSFMQAAGNQEIAGFEASVLCDFKKKSAFKALLLSEL